MYMEFDKQNRNFEKFLIDRNGDIVGRFKSGVAPDDPALIQAIELSL